MLVSPYRLPEEGGFSLKLGQLYEVLGIEADYYRILTDPINPIFSNEPVLYEPDIFNIIDPIEPSFWVSELGETGERYAYPINWFKRNFFEDYHNDVETVKKQFWKDVEFYYPWTWNKIIARSS